MKIALILAIRDRFPNPFAALGLGYVAASVRAKLPDVEVSIKERLDDVIAERPDLVGISSSTENYSVAIEYAKKVKQSLGVPVVVGGVHISMLPASLDDSFDVGVVGEGEKTFVELLQSVIQNKGIRRESLEDVPGLCFHAADGKIQRTAPREIEQDLDSLPPPQLEELPFFHSTPGGTCIVSSRGCPYHCTFCISEKFHQKYRSLSSERIADDIEELVVHKGFKHIVFYDDLLIANRKKVLSLIALMREKGLTGKVSFSCAVRANLIDEEMCVLLKALNVTGVGMGVESFSDRVLEYYNKTAVTAEINQRAIDLLHAYGIVVNPSFIFTAPVETRDDMLATLRQIYRNFRDGKISSPTWCPLIPYPGTKIWDYALERGIVGERMDWDQYQRHFHLCEHVSREEFNDLIEEWLVKFSILLAKEPAKGGTFIIGERPVLLEKIEKLRPKLAARRSAELGDDLIRNFKPSDLPQTSSKGQHEQAQAAKPRTGDPSIEILLSRLAERNESMRALAAKLGEWDESAANELAERERTVRALAAKLAEIGRSNTWKAALAMRKIRTTVAPPKSRRARLLRQAANVALVSWRKLRGHKGIGRWGRGGRQQEVGRGPAKAAVAGDGALCIEPPQVKADGNAEPIKSPGSSQLAAPPEYILIGLTKRCSYRCFFCSTAGGRASAGQQRDVPLEKFFSLQPAIETAGLIDITGPGETLLYPYIREAMAFVAKHNRRNGLQLTTTGALLTDEIIRPVASRINQIAVSLNACTSETYRRDMGSTLWEQVLANIVGARRLLGRSQITLSFVAHGDNIDELPEFVRLAARLDVWHVRITPLRVNKPEYMSRSLWFCKEKTADMVAEAQRIGKKTGVIVSRMYESVQQLSSSEEHPCVVPTWGAYIGINGDVMPCCYSGGHIMGNAFEPGGFEAVWNGPKYQALRKRLYLPQCRQCPNLRGQDMERLENHLEACSEAMATLPRISVAVQAPADVGQVRSAVACLKGQTYPLWEAVFMLGECGDPSVLEAAHEEARKDSRVRCDSAASDPAANVLQRDGGLFCRMDPAHPFKANDLELHLKSSSGLGAVSSRKPG